MQFKTARVYPLTEDFAHSADELATLCEKHAFTECGKNDAVKLGWVRPMGKVGEFVHASNGYFLVTLRKDEKILPGSVVNQILKERIDEKEEAEDRKLSSKEKSEMKDEVIFELLPKAFVKTSLQNAYIDTRNQRIVVDAGSAGKAEELISFLRNTVDSLPCVPLAVNADTLMMMTSWLRSKAAPINFEIGGDCELKDTNGDDGVVTCKNEDLFASQVINHINHGKQVTKIALTWDGKISFMIDKELGFKRIKFLDGVLDDDAYESCTPEERFDTDFSLFTEYFSDMFEEVVTVFDGMINA